MKLKLKPPRAIANGVAVMDLGDDSGEVLVRRTVGDAEAVAMEMMRAVNRDYLFEAMVTALTPFQSGEMGNLLVDLILIDAPPFVSEEAMNETHARLRKLINAIDVILKGVELAKELEMSNG